MSEISKVQHVWTTWRHAISGAWVLERIHLYFRIISMDMTDIKTHIILSAKISSVESDEIFEKFRDL